MSASASAFVRQFKLPVAPVYSRRKGTIFQPIVEPFSQGASLHLQHGRDGRPYVSMSPILLAWLVFYALAVLGALNDRPPVDVALTLAEDFIL